MKNLSSQRVKRLLIPSGIIFFIILLFILPILYAYFNKEEERSKTDLERINQISLKTIDDRDVDLNSDGNKLLVINSWSTWCPFCVDELPHFVQLQKEYKDRIVVVAINRGEPVEANKTFFSVTNIDKDQVLFLIDEEDRFYKEINGVGMPETIFIDSSGEIIEHIRGPIDIEQMREITERLLN